MRRLCFIWAVIGCLSPAAVRPGPAKARQPTLVVRADKRTGRLIRSVAIPEGVDWKRTPSLDAPLQQLIEEVASQYNVDPLLVAAVIEVESNYNPYAVSPRGAEGLMQLIPATARRFGAQNSFHVRQNIEAGVRYLRRLLNLYPHDLRLALAAYNAGEGAVARFGHAVPPYRETEEYVLKVGQRYEAARRRAQNQGAKESLSAEDKPPVIVSYLDSYGRLWLRTEPARSPGRP